MACLWLKAAKYKQFIYNSNRIMTNSSLNHVRHCRPWLCFCDMIITFNWVITIPVVATTTSNNNFSLKNCARRIFSWLVRTSYLFPFIIFYAKFYARTCGVGKISTPDHIYLIHKITCAKESSFIINISYMFPSFSDKRVLFYIHLLT